MNHPRLILDYASPRRHSKLRIKAKSSLKFSFYFNELNVVETLRAGVVSACFGLIVAAFCVAFMGLMLFSVLTNRLYMGPGGWVMIVFLVVLPLIELSIAAAVVQQTFRRTRLSATGAGLRLSFWSVFKRPRYSWGAGDVSNVTVMVTESGDRGRLGELVIDLFDEGRIRLFTDHPVRDLNELCKLIRFSIGWNLRAEPSAVQIVQT